ncbi:hypothetical protein EI94DRAFT_1701841 [Lactarius quietus]|nr:hypothetical protein EI94DRAFT_1701841 [Lactarius quietus]
MTFRSDDGKGGRLSQIGTLPPLQQVRMELSLLHGHQGAELDGGAAAGCATPGDNILSFNLLTQSLVVGLFGFGTTVAVILVAKGMAAMKEQVDLLKSILKKIWYELVVMWEFSVDSSVESGGWRDITSLFIIFHP